MVDLDLCYTPATELMRRYLAGEISPVDVVQNSLDRIRGGKRDPQLFLFYLPRGSSWKRRKPPNRCWLQVTHVPLEGIPLAIKDFTPTRGKVTTRGSRLLQDWTPDWNPVLVERLEAAGAIMVGKTNNTGIRYLGIYRLTVMGYHPQSLGYIAYSRRFVWRVGRRGRVGLRTLCRGHRHGRQRAHSSRAMRYRWSQTFPGPDSNGYYRYESTATFRISARWRALSDDAALFLDVVQGEHPSDIQSLPRCELDASCTQ